MTHLSEGRFTYSFPESWTAFKYDAAPYYQSTLSRAFGGTKGVDFVAHDPSDGTVWLIEVTDYASGGMERRTDIVKEAGKKFRDTLAGLLLMMRWAGDPYRADADRVVHGALHYKFLLHIEFPKSGVAIMKGAGDHRALEQLLIRQFTKVARKVRVVDGRAHAAWRVSTGPAKGT